MRQPTHLKELRRTRQWNDLKIDDARFGKIWHDFELPSLKSAEQLTEFAEAASTAVGNAAGEKYHTEFLQSAAALKDRLGGYHTLLRELDELLASANPRRARNQQDIDLLQLITRVVERSDGPLAVSPKGLRFAGEVVEQLLRDCRQAQKALEDIPKSGPGKFYWYEHIVECALQIGTAVGIRPTIGADRSNNSSDTPFVRVVFALDSLLPDDSRVESLSACAKRIERSSAWRSWKKANSPPATDPTPDQE